MQKTNKQTICDLSMYICFCERAKKGYKFSSKNARRDLKEGKKNKKEIIPRLGF